MKLVQIVAVFICGVIAVAAGLHSAASRLLLRIDENPSRKHVLLENWSGDIDQFVAARAASGAPDSADFCAFIFEDLHNDSTELERFIRAAHVAGLDTAKIRLIPVPHENPKTLNIAAAVLDSASAWGWDTLTVVTARLHTARSGEVYRQLARARGMSVQIIGAAYMGITEENWFTSWEGVETVLEELIKRIYYDIFVM